MIKWNSIFDDKFYQVAENWPPPKSCPEICWTDHRASEVEHGRCNKALGHTGSHNCDTCEKNSKGRKEEGHISFGNFTST